MENKIGMWGFILSLLAYVVGGLGFVLAVAGIILSIVGLVNVKKDPKVGGKGLSIAGIVLGVGLLVISFAFAAFMGLPAEAPTDFKVEGVSNTALANTYWQTSYFGVTELAFSKSTTDSITLKNNNYENLLVQKISFDGKEVIFDDVLVTRGEQLSFEGDFGCSSDVSEVSGNLIVEYREDGNENVETFSGKYSLFALCAN